MICSMSVLLWLLWCKCVFAMNNTLDSSLATKPATTETPDWTRIVYDVKNVSSVTVQVQAYNRVEVIVFGAMKLSGFLVLQIHANKPLILSYTREYWDNYYVNDTNAGLVLLINDAGFPRAFLRNDHPEALSVLVVVRNYPEEAPVPGSNPSYEYPKPYVDVSQNIVVTTITIPTCRWERTHDSNVPAHYEIYLTYMYEGDTNEEHYWKTAALTSNVSRLPTIAKKVDSFVLHSNISSVNKTLVSYTGVGAVVTVAAYYNESCKSLYTTTIFYGCDFLPGDDFDCTKLVTPFAGMFCASLLVIGPILALVGHRWLNFTLFISGSFFSWFILFVIFIHVDDASTNAVGVFTGTASILAGVGWVLIWHKVHRPFLSAMLIILMNGLFIAMVSTHFLKYALVPTKNNIAVFIVIPITFCLISVLYSIKKMKHVHIFACALLGSYLTMVPPAFYFGSSLTYIVINCVSVMTIPHFSEVVGYPPFQNSDIALVVVWFFFFAMAMNVQLMKERNAPPFHPPNRQYYDSFKHMMSVIQLRVYTVCCSPAPPDNDSLHEEDSSTIFGRFLRFVSCGTSDSSRYESFPRIGSSSEISFWHRTIHRTQEFFRNLWLRFRGRSRSRSSSSNEDLTRCRDHMEDEAEPTTEVSSHPEAI